MKLKELAESLANKCNENCECGKADLCVADSAEECPFNTDPQPNLRIVCSEQEITTEMWEEELKNLTW